MSYYNYINNANEGMKMNNEHLAALTNNLNKEKSRLANAKSSSEKEMRQVWVNQLEKEIASEIEFLEKNNIKVEVFNSNDDELLAELFS